MLGMWGRASVCWWRREGARGLGVQAFPGTMESAEARREGDGTGLDRVENEREEGKRGTRTQISCQETRGTKGCRGEED